MNVTEFREDLCNMSLNDALLKHETNLRSAVQLLQNKPSRQYKKSKVTPSPEQYILIRGGICTIRKSVKGRTRIFGSYNSLEDAVRMREALEEDGWHQRHVDRLCDELCIERRTGHINEKVRYH